MLKIVTLLITEILADSDETGRGSREMATTGVNVNARC